MSGLLGLVLDSDFILLIIILLEFAFSGNKITAILLCVGVIAINLVFVIDQVNDADMNSWYMVLIGETDKRTNQINTSDSCTDAGSLSIPPFQ